MTHKELVISRYPRAICWTNNLFYNRLTIYDPPKNCEAEIYWGMALSGHFATEDEAWEDAAKKLNLISL